MYQVEKYAHDQWTKIPNSFETFKDAITHLTGEVIQVECQDKEFRVWIEQYGDVSLYKLKEQ